ncbi:NAD-dependent epimerase/dehydratase family protein [Luteimonas changyuni]|uniref:NAD-dependent epimerase/dehydratase family protein n=1 Tax=Luteimonas sp. MJ145 TaxID=3129234 RepID=UPI0031BB2D25
MAMIDARPVLVLGAGGFVGHALCTALAAAGTRVIALGGGRSPPGSGITHHPGRVDPSDGFAELLDSAGSIVHCATASTPGSTAGAPLRELEGNLRLTVRMLELLHARPRPLLYLSSGGSLYAEGETPAHEASQVRPRSYHGAGKLAAESFIGAWSAQTGASAVILRPSNIYGPGQSGRAGFAIIPTAFDRILRDESLAIWGDGSARRDYLYIEDLMRLCMMVLSRPMREGVTILNASAGASTPLNKLLEIIESVTGGALRREYQPSRAVDAPAIDMDASLADRLYGWRHCHSLADGLAKTWAWYRTEHGAS